MRIRTHPVAALALLLVMTLTPARSQSASSKDSKKTPPAQSTIQMLPPIQLTITEETIGLQTKYKLYEHHWVNYQLNASEYVRERLQLLSADNSMLNITKRFDYELAGATHHFQIIFIRQGGDKSNNRLIREIRPVTLTVEDLNDEAPAWVMDEPVPYTAVIERDPRPGTVLFTFHASDPDTSSEVIYRLHSKSPNTSRLTMNRQGKIIAEPGAPLHYDSYKLVVSAYDSRAPHNANKSQEIFAELIIYVGRRAPQFYQSDYRVNISESSSIGTLVANMRAKSFFNPDLANKKHLRYSLATKSGQQSAEFSIYSDNGTVMLARKVDYESDMREFNLVVTVSEQSGWLMSATAKLTVYIEDANDNEPQFTLSEYVKGEPVSENVPDNTFIIQVEVQDRDSGPNGRIEWSLTDPHFYIKHISNSDSKRANIYNKARLDYEIAQHTYRFEVRACDQGAVPLCASAKVSVPMSNVNDEKPKFDQKVIVANLDENVPPGAYVTTIQATDGDGDRVFFSIKDANLTPFEINRESGIVKVRADSRINPREDFYNLTIYADDDGSCCCGSSGNAHGANRAHLRLYSANCRVETNREEATLVIRIRDINDHAPKFFDCEAYSRQAMVEEERPVGTPVIQVKAHDEDKGENGQVEYEILQTGNERNAPFKINPATGEIRTNVVFDRESSEAKLSEYSVTVKAKDRGKPHPLSDACSFRIKIVDVNDQVPTFYEREYTLSMKYGTQPGHNIQRIIATDADAGHNAEIKYRIDESNLGGEPYFTVDELTGMISLQRDISNAMRPNSPISFNLVAEDHGVPPLSSSVRVNVVFADRDNEPPRWLPETEKRFERIVRIPEAISLNQVVETLDAESNYAPNSKLIFDFSPKPHPESFIIQQERIPGTNRYRGKIIVYQPLDAETKSFYELHVRVQNAAAQPMEIVGVVRVEILDSNDNIPLFTSPTYLANVSENMSPGTYVTKVTAEDKDISAPNNQVMYTIGEPDHSRKFQIDSYTGNITTRVTLDREETKVYFIDVTACDSAMSDRPNMNTPNCRTANVRIDVADTNDNEPYFVQDEYEASVMENAERGTPVISIQAQDRDEQNSQLRYIITDGNEANVFAVRETIGEIYVANNGKLDYETLDEYTLQLTVSDGIHNASTSVRVSLIDVNDNPPVFSEQPPYDVELVEEDLNFPRVILKINATDGDIKRPNTIVYKINYNYTQNSSVFRPFSINADTGDIILQEKLDRDWPNGRAVWSFNVIASDEGGREGSMSSTAVVNVRLIDINDNAPVFDRPPYVGHVLENSPPGTLIMTVVANDYDDPQMGQNAILRYQIAENKKFGNVDIFSINETTGQIAQNVMLDREQIDKYTIEVCASDGSGKRGCGQITIYVDDTNDQAPAFQATTYTETINEDFPIGERVLMVTATDRDQGANAELTYGLRSECLVTNGVYTGQECEDLTSGEPKYFKVDTEREANSGFVKLAKAVNFDPPHYHRLFKLNVSVSDGVALNYTTVFINIADVNDEAPQFSEPVKNVRILESVAPFSLITNFSATDLDTNEMNRRFSYSMDRKSDGSHEFSIDQNGVIYSIEPLDRELKDRYILRVFATDEGYPSQTGIATLNLELVDVNDNAPLFAENYRPVIMENSRASQFVVRVRGKDLDGPENGAPFKFSLPDQLTVWPSKKEGSRFNMTFVRDEADNYADIHSLVSFDRESKDCLKLSSRSAPISRYDEENECKTYRVPVLMSDSGSPPMSGTNYLTVTIGDVNDNLHLPGHKSITVWDVALKTRPGDNDDGFVFIGSVFADDKDDWDAADKEFKLDTTSSPHVEYFDIVESLEASSERTKSPGTIFMKRGVKPGSYQLKVSVSDLTRPSYEPQPCTVEINVRTLTDDALKNSASIRLGGISPEKLIETRYSANGLSLLDEIKLYLSSGVFKLKTDEHLEIFSVMVNNGDRVDIRYTVLTSPVHRAMRLNGILAHHRSSFQRFLHTIDARIKVISIGIDECHDSEKRCKDGGCRSFTRYGSQPAVVNANATSLVGVWATEHAECICASVSGVGRHSKGCTDRNYCLNGGVCQVEASVQRCRCPHGFDGPRCQRLVRSFNSSSAVAWLPALPQCADFIFSMEFVTSQQRGLLFYNGPIIPTDSIVSSSRNQNDYLAVQLDKGRVVVSVRHGVDAKQRTVMLGLVQNRSLADGHWHRIDVYKRGMKYRVTLDKCASDNAECEAEFVYDIHDIYLNVAKDYPMQLGGVFDRKQLPKGLDYKGSFGGCVRNVQFNGELYDLEVSTPRLLGFSANSSAGCARADRQCSATLANYTCINGVCEADYENAQCVCKAGYRGRQCEIRAHAFDFQTPAVNKRAGSYLKYRYVYQSEYANSAYEAQLRRETKVQMLFRTRENTTDRVQTLFQMTSPNRAQYTYLEIADNRVQFRYELGSGENIVRLSSVVVNDGKWHLVRAHRFGAEATLAVDEGELAQMNYSRGMPNGLREMEVDRDSIFLGAKVLQVKVSGYEISRDYSDSCMMDVRFDERPLPFTPGEEKTYEDVAIKMESVNVKEGCASTDYCKGIFCAAGKKCVDLWRLGECQCPKGQHFNGTRCEMDLNSGDCSMCLHEGTSYCERFDTNQIINYYTADTSNDIETSLVGQFDEEYPPRAWYYIPIGRESTTVYSYANTYPSGDDNGANYKCVCRPGFYGMYCNAQASVVRTMGFLNLETLITVLSCLILLLVLVLICVVYSRTRHSPPKHYMLGVDPNDEVRETIINYVEEGCPDVDQSTYDITQLAKPIDPTMSIANLYSTANPLHVVDGEFQPAVAKPKPPIQEIQLIRRDVPPVIQVPKVKPQRPHNPDVGDFINSKLYEIQNDPIQPPYDSLQEYAYEGEGSINGSILSEMEFETPRNQPFNIIKKIDENENSKESDRQPSECDNKVEMIDQEAIENLGPKFKKLYDIFGDSSDDNKVDLGDKPKSNQL